MGIYVGDTEIKGIYLGDTPVKEVYLGDTKIRPTIIPVTGVSLNTSSISFTAKNQTNQLTATVIPSTATNKNVTWASSNTSVATVSSSGLVTCKGNGNCTITVTTQDGGYTATCGVVAVVPRTFTISRTEKSNMSSGWTYSDDAAGLTAGSTAFDEFFGYSAVRLNNSGVETAVVTQAQSGGPGKLNITQLGTLTSGNNVMIKFPLRGIKMTKSGTTVTLSITEETNKSGYQYYAFNSNGTKKSNLYIGAYKGSLSGSYLMSWSGASSIGNFSLDSAVAAANAYGGRYHEISWYARQYINALYMMKYGNPNSQSVVGMGYTGGSSAQATGATNSITNATGATNTSNTGRIKLFGLEDWRGNVYENIDGAYFLGDSTLQTSTTGAFSTTSKITSFNKSLTIGGGYIRSIVGSNDGMFAGYSGGGSNTTYYCDYFGPSSTYYLTAGGERDQDKAGGAFRVGNQSSSQSYSYSGSRLMFL